MRRALLFILLLGVAATVGALCAPHHEGKSANPSWLYSWARPRTVVVSRAPTRHDGRPRPAGTRGHTRASHLAARAAIHFRWTPDGIVTQGFLDLNSCRSLPAWPTEKGACSRRVFALLLSSPWVLHGTAGAHRLSAWQASCWASSPSAALLAIVQIPALRALVVPPRPRLATEDLLECDHAKPPAIRWTRPRPISALTPPRGLLRGVRPSFKLT